MQVGCGVYEHRVGDRFYLYFWHYETRDSRRRQVSEYLGPVESPRTRSEAVRRCEAYYTRVAREMDRARREAISDLFARG